jgi:hypothetical protein
MRNRIGKIKVTEQLLFDINGIFRHFNPISIDIKEYDIYEYTCVSMLFDELKETDIIPQYEVYFTFLNDETGEYLIDKTTVRRLK